MTHDVSKVNGYFEKMADTCREFDEAKAIRDAEKKAILTAAIMDRDALDAWYEREEQFQYPYSKGQMKAYWVWKESSDSEPTCNELPFEKDMADFSATLVAAGYTTLIVTDQSTGLMRGLHFLNNLGWRPDGLCTHTQTNRWGEQIQQPGIRLNLK